MFTLPSVQGHTSLIHPPARLPECQKIKKVGLADQYGPELFGRLNFMIFATIRKVWDWKG